jgi:glycosyltransferase involved in cell wall biosynthesis
LCEPDDLTSLTDKIEELLLNPTQSTALGERGRDAINEKFSVEAMARATLRVFEIANRKL